MDLKRAIELCVMQYGIMYHGHDAYSQSKLSAIREMKKEGLIDGKLPKNKCFLCEYVQQTFTAPGYDAIEYVGSSGRRRNRWHAFCVLACPMTGILWDWRGCMHNTDSAYQKMECAYSVPERKKHIETMLCAFQELLGEIQHEEEKDAGKKNSMQVG